MICQSQIYSKRLNVLLNFLFVTQNYKNNFIVEQPTKPLAGRNTTSSVAKRENG